jgi:hypothetical protein
VVPGCGSAGRSGGAMRPGGWNSGVGLPCPGVISGWFGGWYSGIVPGMLSGVCSRAHAACELPACTQLGTCNYAAV